MILGSTGEGTLRALVPARSGGDRLLLQALTFDPPLGACAVSGIFPFPLIEPR